MIVQWVKLHSSYFDELVPAYGAVVQSQTPIGVVKLGNVITWSRKNLWKCIEFTGTMWIEHIVLLEGVHEPIVPLLSKYIEAKIFAYSHIYSAGIKNLAKSKYISSPNSNPIGKTIYDLVMERALSSYSYLPNIMHDWFKKNTDVDKIAPINYSSIFGSVDDVNSEWTAMLPAEFDRSGMGSYIRHELKNPRSVSYISEIANGVYDNLSDVLEGVKNGYYRQSELNDTISAMFTPWKNRYSNISTMINKKRFVAGDASAAEVSRLQETGFEHETFVAFPITNYPGIDWTVELSTPTEYSKELVAFVEFIQTINLTDFDITFDILAFENSVYDYRNCHTTNRYYMKEDLNGILFPYMQETVASTEYAFKDYVKDIGQALCDYLITNHPMMLARFDTIRLIKTYNEDLLIVLSSNNDPTDSEIIYIDMIGHLLCGQNMGGMNYFQSMGVSI